MSLVEEGVLELTTPARALLGDDLPLVSDDVTVEHLLAHTSGIGDYLDEDELDSMYRLRADATGAHPGHRGELSVGPRRRPYRLRGRGDGSPTTTAATCCSRSWPNAPVAPTYHDLVRNRVVEPAGLTDTAFLRSDELPGTAALGYLGSRRAPYQRAAPAGGRRR